MTADIHARLDEMNLSLPEVFAPAANYVPSVRSGNLLFVSGQISQSADGLVTGKVGEDMTVEDGAAAAQLCGLSLLAQVGAVEQLNLMISVLFQKTNNHKNQKLLIMILI